VPLTECDIKNGNVNNMDEKVKCEDHKNDIGVIEKGII
jgi:hypothetical protein